MTVKCQPQCTPRHLIIIIIAATFYLIPDEIDDVEAHKYVYHSVYCAHHNRLRQGSPVSTVTTARDDGSGASSASEAKVNNPRPISCCRRKTPPPTTAATAVAVLAWCRARLLLPQDALGSYTRPTRAAARRRARCRAPRASAGAPPCSARCCAKGNAREGRNGRGSVSQSVSQPCAHGQGGRSHALAAASKQEQHTADSTQHAAGSAQLAKQLRAHRKCL